MLGHYRVIDRTDERGAFAGHLLGQLGADVVLAEPPGGGGTRHAAPFVAAAGPEASLWHHAYGRSKRSAVVDDDGLRALAATADVWLRSGTPAELAARGEPTVAELHAINPALVVTTISPYGSSGPKADWRSSDLVVGVAGSQTMLTGDADLPPLRCAVPQVFLHASIDAAAGTLVALRERRRSGLGQHVDVSAQHSWTWSPFMYAFGAAWGTQYTRGGSMPAVNGVATRFDFPAADGFITLTLLFGSAVGPFTNRFVAWMRDEGEVSPEVAAADWASFNPDGAPLLDQLKQEVTAFCARRTKAELLAAARERRLLVAPVQTLDDLVGSEQFGQRQAWRPVLGAQGPGPFVKALGGPALRVGDAPTLGGDTAAVLAEAAARPRPPRVATPDGAPAATGALAGVKVLDLTISFAGPAIGRVLADFGATVVKVESVERADLARNSGPYLGEGIDGSACFAHFNAGKASLSLNVKAPGAAAVLHDLARWADVLVDSFAPGALARMGLDDATLEALNPNLVRLSTSMLGQTGPFATLAGYGNMASALSGFFATTGWPGRSPVGPVGAYTDTISPRLAVSAIVAGLEHRDRTGRGIAFDLGQGEACLHLLSVGLLDHQLNGRSYESRGNDDPFVAPHGVYPCAGDDRWVAVVCNTDDEWRSLAGVLGCAELAGLAATERLARRAELDALVAAWTATRADTEAQAELQAAGVPAHRAQYGVDCLEDPQLTHRGWMHPARHGLFGEMLVGSQPIHLSRTPASTPVAGPCLGEHTDWVLREVLGYGDDRVADLAIAGALE